MSIAIELESNKERNAILTKGEADTDDRPSHDEQNGGNSGRRILTSIINVFLPTAILIAVTKLLNC